MIEVFYIVLLIVFGILIIITLTQFGMRSNALREEIVHFRENREHQEERTVAIRQELEDLALDIEGLEQEKASLESQEACMRNLDKFSAASEAENGTGTSI